MPCERVGPAIVCSRGSRKRNRCIYCGGYSTKLCDGPKLGSARTCDKPLCTSCAYHVPPDRDYCRDHAPQAEADAKADLLTEAVDLVESRMVDPKKG